MKQMTKLADILTEKGISKNEDKEIIVYGLTSGIELIFNITTTIALGFIFGMVIESLIFLISFSLIRTYAGGYHCKKAINCYLFSSGVVVLVLTIVKFSPKGNILVSSLMMLLIAIPIILRLAPVETETKPLDEVEQKHFRNKTIFHLAVEGIVIIILFLFKSYVLGYVICLGFLMSAMLVLLGYKQITNQRTKLKEETTMLKIKKLFSMALAVGVLASTTAFASNATAKIHTLYGDAKNQSFTISDESLTKEQSEQIAQERLDQISQSRQYRRSIYSYHDSVSAEKRVDYSDGVVKSSFDADLYVDGFPGYVVEISGESKDFWTGYNPIDADSINASDTFKYNTFGIAGLSISYPASAGVSFSAGTDSAVLSYPEHTDDFQYYHTFDGVSAETGVLGSITKYTHTHSTTMKFGNRTVSATCNDSTTVW